MLPTSIRLRRILAAYTVNKLGTWFGTVALSLAVYDRTHSAAAVTALFVARYLPALIVPALVARVEASTRRGALGALYALEAVCTALLAALVWQFALAAILVLVAVDGALELTASSLLRAQAARAGAAAPRTGSAERGVYDANAALNVALSASVVIGPTLGALAVKALGAPTALLIDAGSFVACGALLVDLCAYVEERTGGSVRARLRAARTYVREAPTLRSLLWIQAGALVFFETAAPVEVFYAKATLRAGDVGYGVLLAVWGVGQLGGSVLFARGARRSLGAMLTLGTLAVGLAYLGFAAAPALAVAAGAALVGGLGNGVQWASLLGSVQLLTPERLRGRLLGGVEAIGALCPLVGLPLSGAVMALSSPRVAFLTFGSMIALATLGFARLWASGAIRPAKTGDPQPAGSADDAPGDAVGEVTRSIHPLDPSPAGPIQTTHSG